MLNAFFHHKRSGIYAKLCSFSIFCLYLSQLVYRSVLVLLLILLAFYLELLDAALLTINDFPQDIFKDATVFRLRDFIINEALCRQASSECKSGSIQSTASLGQSLIVTNFIRTFQKLLSAG